MAFSLQQIEEARRRAGFTNPASRQDIENANRFGLGIFGATAARLRGGQSPASGSLAEQFAREYASLIPQQEAPPSFEESGLFDEANAGRQFETQFIPFFTRQRQTEEQRRGFAETDMQRILADLQRQKSEGLEHLGNTAATAEQTGSGAQIREQQRLFDLAKRQGQQTREGFTREYEGELSPYQSRLRDIGDQQTVSRADYISKLRDEARRRYLDRFRTQPAT